MGMWTALLTLAGCSGPSVGTGAPAVERRAERPVASKTIDSVKLEPGVYLHQHTIVREGVPMRMWLYLPAETITAPVGCVVIAVAGGTGVSGNKLSVLSRPEHVPYVRKGFVVAAYDVDGKIPKGASEPAAIAAITAFRDAHAGLDNARAALDYALSVVPSIDKKRIFAAGHSSAATLALLFAAEEPRIRAVAAYAPITDLITDLPANYQSWLASQIPGFREFLRWSSPLTHVAALRDKPVFVQHALNDKLVDVEQTERLMSALKPGHPASKMLIVPTGNHYDSMIRDGLPQGLSWLLALQARQD